MQMNLVRPKNVGICYLRRSTNKQEVSLVVQLKWCMEEAERQGVKLDATLEDIDYIVSNKLNCYKGIYLDAGVSGSNLNRPGIIAFFARLHSDNQVSHVFFHKLDRFGRPRNPAEAVNKIISICTSGVTLVHLDGVVKPEHPWSENLILILTIMLSLAQGKSELIKLSHRMLTAQQELAQAGYRVGGSAPYGFGRFLVDSNGEVVQELAHGETMRRSKCHVVLLPKDHVKIGFWVQMLEWRLDGWGFSRIASQLNNWGIPSPSAGIDRNTSGGRKKSVSGIWKKTTVAEICRNPIIIGEQHYGRRSEGKIYRIGKDGPRLADPNSEFKDGDMDMPLVIKNDASLQIRETVGEEFFPKESWLRIQEMDKRRGKNQRGIPRSSDLSKFPLSGCLVDLSNGCGHHMHGREHSGRNVYTCGRYMNLGRQACGHNQIDAEAILNFVLDTIKQIINVHGGRDQLKAKLKGLAIAEGEGNEFDLNATRLKHAQQSMLALEKDIKAISRNMARASDDVIARALENEYRNASTELDKIKENVNQLEALQAHKKLTGPDSQIDSALAIFDNIRMVVTDPASRVRINPMLKEIGLKIGLRYETRIKGKKRYVQQLVGGFVTFDNIPLPGLNTSDDQQSDVPVNVEFRNNTVDNQLDEVNVKERDGTGLRNSQLHTNQVIANGAITVEQFLSNPLGLINAGGNQQKGISCRMVNRGDWI